MNRSDSDNFKAGCIIVSAAVIGIGLIVLFFSSTSHVGSSEIGVINNAGYVDKNQTPLGPGWHTITPFAQGVDAVSTNQQSHAFAEIQAAAANSQNVYIDGT